MTGDPTPRATIDAELEASLLRELVRTWRSLATSLFRGGLRPPVFRLIDSRTLLGRWQREQRTIELSRALVFERGWGEVIEVLKHEMAHQYVHEVLGAVDESAHGAAFRGACERMGIDPAASGLPKEGGERSRILDKVSGLMALADSPNRNEAEAAASAAQRLMLKHNIELSERPERQRYAYRYLGVPKGRVQESEHLLAGILAEFFFVEAIWVPGYRPGDDTRGSVLELCGTPDNLDIAEYVHGFLSGTAERLWRQHRREQGIASNRDRRTYLAGVMEGFRHKLALDKRAQKERGLVWLGDADLRDYYRRRHPYVRSIRLAGRSGSEARAEGRRAGGQIVLQKGVTAAATDRGRALPPKR